MALNNIHNVDERFIISAARKWWKYRIADRWKISPQEVEKWDAEDILEALAYIGFKERNAPNGGDIE